MLTVIIFSELMMISAEVQELPVTVRRVNVQREREKNNLNLNMSDFIGLSNFYVLYHSDFFDTIIRSKIPLQNLFLWKRGSSLMN